MEIKCLIIDDEPLARRGLAEYIEDIDFLELVAQCDSAMSADKVLNQTKIDLIFLDIQMPKMTGIQFLKALKMPPRVIFTTAYSEYALESFDLDVLDYLVKPIPFERFYKACKKAKAYFELLNFSHEPSLQLPVSAPDFLFVKSDHIIEKISFDDILFIEAIENYVLIHTPERKYVVHITLKSVEDFLPPEQFLKVHKSYLISVTKITAIEGAQLIVGTHKIPVSRHLKEEIFGGILKNNFLKK
jgi:DNA-binding LytR/AlgR family response regulator